MSRDRRLYAKFTLDFARHPKIAILSDAAFRCLVEAILYSRDQLSDGLLARRYALATWGVDVLAELCANDDEKPSLIEVEKGWLIHDYAEQQDTKEDVEARRERSKVAGQKGGLAKAKRGGKRTAKQPASEALSGNVAETETETHRTTPAKAVVGAHNRGTRLPNLWRPSDKTIREMAERFPAVDLKSEHEKFSNYWLAQPGAKGRKSDWEATWRNWIIRAGEQQTPQRNGQSPAARKVGVGLELANRLGNTTPELTA